MLAGPGFIESSRTRPTTLLWFNSNSSPSNALSIGLISTVRPFAPILPRAVWVAMTHTPFFRMTARTTLCHYTWTSARLTTLVVCFSNLSFSLTEAITATHGGPWSPVSEGTVNRSTLVGALRIGAGSYLRLTSLATSNWLICRFYDYNVWHVFTTQSLVRAAPVLL